MNEDQLIQTFFKTDSLDPSVVLGIGDDAAVLEVPEGFQLVISTDTLIEGRHFPRGYPAAAVASRAVGVCISDLAAMGAIPKWVTMSLVLPQVESSWLETFSHSLHDSLRNYSVSLVGGDTVKGDLSLSLSVMGVVETGYALRRDSAQVGDDIYVSGSLGGSAFALYRLLAKENGNDSVMQQFSAPQARVILGRSLLRIASACMDVSDGILLDLSRLLDMSQLGAEVYLEQFPLHPAINNLALDTQIQFATSGDDYELLFTAGKLVSGSDLVTLSNGRVFDIEKHGYQHF